MRGGVRGESAGQGKPLLVARIEGLLRLVPSVPVGVRARRHALLLHRPRGSPLLSGCVLRLGHGDAAGRGNGRTVKTIINQRIDQLA